MLRKESEEEQLDVREVNNWPIQEIVDGEITTRRKYSTKYSIAY